MKKTNKLDPYKHEPKKGVSWRAVFAGVVCVLSIMLILNLIGLAIGMGVIEPTEQDDPMGGVGTGAVIWWVISNLIALFAGGFVAARAGVSFTDVSGVLQGILTWALYTLLSMWLLTTIIGNILSGVGTAVGGALTATGDVVEQLGPVVEDQLDEIDISMERLQQELMAILEDAGVDTDELEEADIEDILRDGINVFDGTLEELDRQALVDLLVERTDMSEEEAEEAVDEIEARYEQARQDIQNFLQDAETEARQIAEDLTDAIAEAAAYLAIALILGIMAAAAGGMIGVYNLREDYEANYYSKQHSEPEARHGSSYEDEPRLDPKRSKPGQGPRSDA